LIERDTQGICAPLVFIDDSLRQIPVQRLDQAGRVRRVLTHFSVRQAVIVQRLTASSTSNTVDRRFATRAAYASSIIDGPLYSGGRLNGKGWYCFQAQSLRSLNQRQLRACLYAIEHDFRAGG
jgi:hypothetical protein